MIIDVHCHTGFSARRVETSGLRFSFERDGAAGRPGFDSYFSPRVMRKWALLFRVPAVRRAMGIDWDGQPGEALDRRIQAFNDRHILATPSVDRIVLLAFDEYHTDAGVAVGPPPGTAGILPARTSGIIPCEALGSDLYVSNSLVRHLCAARPAKLLFGASLHPYRRDALALLPELKAAGAVLVKWLPVHQNIDAADPRSVAFLRKAAELHLPMLIHYGGESTLARQHPRFEDPDGLLATLRTLRREGRMPTTIVAHVATPSFFFQSAAAHNRFIASLVGEFRDAPLYADISGMSLGRAPFVLRFLRRPAVQRQLVWGTDFPIPPFLSVFWPWLGRSVFDLRHVPSWIERDLLLKRRLGFDEAVFHRAAEILALPPLGPISPPILEGYRPR